MSDTPRTDAAARHVSVDRAGCIMLWHSVTGGYVERKVSEQLERENAALRTLLREALDCIDQYDYEEAFDLVHRIKDALGHSQPSVIPWSGSNLTEMEELLQNEALYKTLSAAIDAARKEGQP